MRPLEIRQAHSYFKNAVQILEVLSLKDSFTLLKFYVCPTLRNTGVWTELS